MDERAVMTKAQVFDIYATDDERQRYAQATDLNERYRLVLRVTKRALDVGDIVEVRRYCESVGELEEE